MNHNHESRLNGKFPISIFHGLEAHHTGTVDEELQVSLKELAGVITKTSWSPATFIEENGIKRRTRGTLQGISLLALDIDGGCDLEVAKTHFQDYACIIATTRNHQKQKPISGGKVRSACDRFRVILVLSEDILSDADYKATWAEAARKWSFIDPACKDSCRFFFPCVDVISSTLNGVLFPVTYAGKTETQEKQSHADKCPSSVTRGRLSWRTQDFLLNGADPWHHRYHLACIDLKEQNYTQDEARELLARAAQSFLGYLDAEDERQLQHVYDHHVPKYPPRAHYRDGHDDGHRGHDHDDVDVDQHDDRAHHAVHRSSPQRFSGGSNDRRYTGSTPAQRLQRIEHERAVRLEALKNQAPFVCDAFQGIFSLSMGLNLIGACTGGGKTTTAANILAHFFFHRRDRQALVITNEETAEDVINRVACVLLEVNFFHFRRNALPEATLQAVENMAQKVAQRIEVVDKEDGWDMTCLEDVQAVLEYAMQADKGFGLVVLDYLQTVAFSRKKELESVAISKILGHYLKDYGRRVPMPVVVFGQLHPDPDKKTDFSARFQNDRTIVNHAVAAIEVIPDYENRQAHFIIHKDRFGEAQKRSVFVSYREGRFTRLRQYGQLSPVPQASDAESQGGTGKEQP